MNQPGLSLVELRAIVRMLNAILDMADDEEMQQLPVEGVRDLRDKYAHQIKTIERFQK